MSARRDGVHLRSIDTRPFIIKDDLRMPDVLHMTRWGDWGYSTWCTNENEAIQEAMCSKSRGRKILGEHEADISTHPWLVFNLRLTAPQVCALLNDFNIVIGTERKNRKTWRIQQDIVIADIVKGGGYMKKTIVAPNDQVWRVSGIFSSSTLARGECDICRRSRYDMLTFEGQCARCYERSALAHAPDPGMAAENAGAEQDMGDEAEPDAEVLDPHDDAEMAFDALQLGYTARDGQRKPKNTKNKMAEVEI